MAVVSKYAKRDPKVGVSCPNFQWRFWSALAGSKYNCSRKEIWLLTHNVAGLGIWSRALHLQYVNPE